MSYCSAFRVMVVVRFTCQPLLLPVCLCVCVGGGECESVCVCKSVRVCVWGGV